MGATDVRPHAERRIAVRVRCPYGTTRISTCTKSFYVHHSQMLGKAAVVHDAKAIRKRITCLKQEVCGAVHAAGSGGTRR